MRQDSGKVSASKARIIEKARQSVIQSLKKNIFKFALIFAFAIIFFIVGKMVLETPHPHLFSGKVTELSSRILLLSVAFLIFVAMAEIKKIADAFCSLFSYEIAGGAKSFNAHVFKKSVLSLRPFFYICIGLVAFLLFQDIFMWIHPLLSVVVSFLIVLWAIVAVYVSFEVLTGHSKVLRKWPLVLVDDLVEVVIHLSSPEIMVKEVDYAYEKTSDEVRKIRGLFKWKYGNLVALALVVLGAYLIANSGAAQIIASKLGELQYFGAFIVGLFFTSVITLPFAIVGIFAMTAVGMNPLLIALIGGLGAMCGDYFLFSAFRRSIDSTKELARKYDIRFPSVNSRAIKIIASIFAGFIIMSPLPDEIGIAILGAVHFNPKYFLILAFLCNAIGIFAIASILV